MVITYIINHPQDLKEIDEKDFANKKYQKVLTTVRKLNIKPQYSELFTMVGEDCTDIYSDSPMNNPGYWSGQLRKYTILRTSQSNREDILEEFTITSEDPETGEMVYTPSPWYEKATMEEVKEKIEAMNEERTRSDKSYIYKCKTVRQDFYYEDELPGADKSMEWLVEGVFMKDSFSELVGPQKSAKTQLALQLAFCVQNGIDFLGHTVKKVDVAYVDYEQEPSELKSRSEKLREFYKKQYNVENSEKFKFMSLCHDMESALKDVLDIIREEKAKNPNLGLVIFDNFYSLLRDGMDSNSMSDMKLLLKNLKQGVGEDITVILVNHTNKAVVREGGKVTYYSIVSSAFGSNVHGMFGSEFLYIEPKTDGKTIWVAGRHVSPELEIPCFFGADTNYFFLPDAIAQGFKLSAEQCQEVDKYLMEKGKANDGKAKQGTKQWKNFKKKFPEYSKKSLEISGYTFETVNGNKLITVRRTEE